MAGHMVHLIRVLASVIQHQHTEADRVLSRSTLVLVNSTPHHLNG